MKKIVIKIKSDQSSSLAPIPSQLQLLTIDPRPCNFNQIANLLLNSTILHVKGKSYRLCEIEFYYCGSEHKDLYTHSSDEQKMHGRFYFHRYRNGTYKSGTYKGLDITLSPSDSTSFGILIRSVQDRETGEVTEGPCRTVNLILEQFNCQTVDQFMIGKVCPLQIDDPSHQLYITNTSELNQEPIFIGPRIGLSDRYPEYRDRPYRYAVMIHSIKK